LAATLPSEIFMQPGEVEPKTMILIFILVKLAFLAKMQPREKSF
jgi:hypothetical protein